MSGSLYTPYPVAGQPTSGGSAFREGFLGAQQIETNVQEMERRRQAARLAELQEQRSQQNELRLQAAEARAAERFPLDLKQTAFTIQQRQLAAPIELERARFTLAEAQRAAAANRDYERQVLELLRTGGFAPGTAPAPVPAPAQAQPGATPGLIMPQAPVAPAAAPAAPATPATPARLPVAPVGPQGSVDGRPSWLNADFGNRRFTGVQEARLGTSDADPTEAEDEAFANVPRVPTRPSFPAFPVPPVGMPERSAVQPSITGADGTVYPVAQPTDNDPVIFGRPLSSYTLPELERLRGLSAAPAQRGAGVVGDRAARTGAQRFDPETGATVPTTQSIIDQRIAVLRSRTAERFPEEPPATVPTSPIAVAPAAATPAGVAVAPATGEEPPERGEELRFRPVGVRPPGEPSAQSITQTVNRRIDTLSTETPTPLSVLSPWQIGNEQRALAERQTALERRRQALLVLARRDPTAALQGFAQLEADAQAIALNRANLNGRIAISEFATGNFAPLAQDMFTASGGRLRLEPRPDGTFNIWGPEGTQRPIRTGVQASEIINQGRLMYDTNYQEQVAAIRTRAIARNEEIFKAHVRGLEEALKQEAQLSREEVVERVKAQAQAQFRGSNMQVTVDTNTGNIIYRDQNGVLPLRILRVVPRPDPTNPSRTRGFMTEEVEVGTAPGQQQVVPAR